MSFPIPLQALRGDAKSEALQSCSFCLAGFGENEEEGRVCASTQGGMRCWAAGQGTYRESVGCLMAGVSYGQCQEVAAQGRFSKERSASTTLRIVFVNHASPSACDLIIPPAPWSQVAMGSFGLI